MEPTDQSAIELSYEQWQQGGRQLAAHAVARFLEIERTDPGWSRDHDEERAQLIDRLHDIGHLREARALVHRWLLGYRDRLVITPSRTAARREHLWRCVADVVERTADQRLLETFWISLGAIRLPSRQTGQCPLPLLGVPILNRFDLLEELLASLDHPVEVMAIVDNSGGKGDLNRQLRQLQEQGHPLIERIEIACPFRNLGVAGSWNHILTSYPEASTTLLINNDVRFAPDVLRSALSAIHNQEACFLPLLPGPDSFSAFLITHQAWDVLGLFDENFHPAYCEDLAYLERLESRPEVTRIQLEELQKAMAECNPERSATIESDAELASFNRVSFQLNRLWLLSRRRHLGDPRGTWLRRWLTQWSD